MNQIATLRKQKNLSQSELAKLADISVRTLSYLENDERTTTIDIAKRIAKVLDTSLDGLFPD